MPAAPAKQTKWINDPIAAAIGRIVMLEERVTELVTEGEQQRERIERQSARIERLEKQLCEMGQPGRLMTEKDVAKILRLHIDTLKSWRKEKPSPRIPFILMEGGDVRYRVEVIEAYLKSRERGNSSAKKGSAK